MSDDASTSFGSVPTGRRLETAFGAHGNGASG
jgi:hypothetical protein